MRTISQQAIDSARLIVESIKATRIDDGTELTTRSVWYELDSPNKYIGLEPPFVVANELLRVVDEADACSAHEADLRRLADFLQSRHQVGAVKHIGIREAVDAAMLIIGEAATAKPTTKDAQFPAGPIDWPTPRDDQFRPLHDPITEDWLRANGYQIESGRNDPRLPTRRLEIGRECAEPSRPFSSDDLCIEVSPCNPKRHDGRWHCWLVKVEPYRVIHVRYVRYTWELVRLYEGLTGRVWPGQCSVKGDEVPQ